MIVTFDHDLFLREKIILEINLPSEIEINFNNTENITAKKIRNTSEEITPIYMRATNSFRITRPTDKYYQKNTIHIFSIQNIKNPVRIFIKN